MYRSTNYGYDNYLEQADYILIKLKKIFKMALQILSNEGKKQEYSRKSIRIYNNTRQETGIK